MDISARNRLRTWIVLTLVLLVLNVVITVSGLY